MEIKDKVVSITGLQAELVWQRHDAWRLPRQQLAEPDRPLVLRNF